MKTAIAALLLLIVCSPIVLCEQNETSELVPGAREFLKYLSEQNFELAAANFDSTMKTVMPPDKLSDTWKSLLEQAGKFKQLSATRTEKMAGYDVVVVTSEFDNAVIDIKVVFNQQGQISGLWFAPAQAAAQYDSPGYVNPRAFRKSEVTVGSDNWKLPGTLTMPWGEELVPAIVLVHGSGPNDRDETIGPNKPFKDIAEGLSSNGIAVLRYEKRTLKYPEQMMAMSESLTVRQETIEDALAAIKLLRQTPGIDTSRIFVLGHSLGGTLTPRIAEADMSIAGLIVMAGMTRPLEDALVEQIEYIFTLDGEISAGEKIQLDSLKQQVALVKSEELSLGTPSRELPIGVPASYWLDLRGYEPAKLAAGLSLPMLILQGERDYQVTMVDFENWKKQLSNRDNVMLRPYPRLNHLFIEGDGKSTPQEYNNSGHISQSVIADIVDWIKKH